MSRSMPRFVGEQVRRPGGADRKRNLRVLERVDATPDEPVAAPGEDQLGAVLQRPLDRARRPLALRYLDPERRGDARFRERAPQLREPAADRLAGMRDDRQFHERLSAAAPAARQANSSTRIAPMPTSTPPATSSGWCMPRYIRDNATKVVNRIAPVQASAFLTGCW